MSSNPFVWTRPLADPASVIGMDRFCTDLARILSSANVVLFSPRGTGKTSLITKLRSVLAAADPPTVVVHVDLQQAVSIPAMIGCIRTAVATHPDRRLRRRAKALFRSLDTTIGFDLKLVSASTTRGDPKHEMAETEALSSALRSLTSLGDSVVVVFDEVQRLAGVPGAPLAAMRSALLGPESGNCSLLLTGSSRHALEVLTTDAAEPLFNQAHHAHLPAIAIDEFAEFITEALAHTDVALTEEAIDHLLDITDAHPRRTQQLAWYTWERLAHENQPGTGTVDTVEDALDELLGTRVGFEFPDPEEEPSQFKALLLLAEHGAKRMTNPAVLHRYGFGSHKTLYRALAALAETGIVEPGPPPSLTDPLLGLWLERNSPFAHL